MVLSASFAYFLKLFLQNKEHWIYICYLNLNTPTQNHNNAFIQPGNVWTVADLHLLYGKCWRICGNIWSTLPSCGQYMEMQQNGILFQSFNITSIVYFPSKRFLLTILKHLKPQTRVQMWGNHIILIHAEGDRTLYSCSQGRSVPGDTWRPCLKKTLPFQIRRYFFK